MHRKGFADMKVQLLVAAFPPRMHSMRNLFSSVGIAPVEQVAVYIVSRGRKANFIRSIGFVRALAATVQRRMHFEVGSLPSTDASFNFNRQRSSSSFNRAKKVGRVRKSKTERENNASYRFLVVAFLRRIGSFAFDAENTF